MAHQAEARSTRSTVLLLGCGHWSNPNLDRLNIEHDDMLAPTRQREIEECLERLGRFRPTKVALEVVADRADELNEEYRRYRVGALALTANERHQLGFRLAAALDHDRVYGIDWHDLRRAIEWEAPFAFAREHDQLDLVGSAAWKPSAVQRAMDEESERLRTLTVRDMLLHFNDPETLWRNHRLYAGLMRVGEGDRYVGADVVCRWYERNMKIFVNLTRITDPYDDRVVVVIGAGHVYLLRHFVEGSGLYALEPAAAYLS